VLQRHVCVTKYTIQSPTKSNPSPSDIMPSREGHSKQGVTPATPTCRTRASKRCKIALGGLSDGASAAAQVTEIDLVGGLIGGAGTASNANKIALGSLSYGAAAAAHASEFAIGSVGDAAASTLEFALGNVGDGADGAGHAHKIALSRYGAPLADPPQLNDPPEIQATTPTHHAVASSFTSLLDVHDFHDEIVWALNKNQKRTTTMLIYSEMIQRTTLRKT